MIRPAALALLALLAAFPLWAQEEEAPAPPLRVGDYLLNLPSPRILAPGAFEVRFTHRFSEPINEGDEHSLWGLDSSADIGIGLAWAATEKLQLGLIRTDLLDDVEASAKYLFLKQSADTPISLAARGGLNWRTEEQVDDRLSPFLQVIVSKQFGRNLELFAMPTYLNDDSRYDHAFNLPVGIAWAWRPYLLVVAEVIPENSDIPDDVDSGIAWSIGLKRAIGGHWFEVLLTDSRATHVDQYTTFPLGGIDSGDVHLGFNIERRFGGRR
jgi:hypothetical protein